MVADVDAARESATVQMDAYHILEEPHKGTTWQRIAAVIVANMLGTGVLSLAFAASVMGWVPFLLALFIFAFGGLYSGLLFARLFEYDPSCQVLADVGKLAYGKWGENFTRVVAYVYIGGVTVIFHLTAALAIQQVFEGVEICKVLCSVIVLAVVLAFSQMREFHSVGLLAAVGVGTIIVPCITVIAVLSHDGVVSGAVTRLVTSDSSTLVEKGVGVMDIVFAFAGQVIFIELQHSMSEPKTFPKAVVVSLVVMQASFLAVSCVGYYYIGEATLLNGDPITSQIRSGWEKRMVNAMLAIHVLIAYVIEGNVLVRGIAHMAGMDHIVTGPSFADRLKWGALSAVIVLSAFTLSNLIPFFSDIMGLMAAMCSVLLTYTLPMVFGVKLLDMSSFERCCLKLLIPLTILLAIAGTTASVADIASKLIDHIEPPFSC